MGQYLGIFILVLQIYFIYHALVRKQYFWAVIIFLIPLFGVIAYFIMKFWPEYQQSGAAEKTSNTLESFFFPEKELQRLRDDYEGAPTFTNKMNLAAGLQKAGQFEEALELYESSAEGFNGDDPVLWEGLSHAYFHLGEYENVIPAVKKLRKVRERPTPNEFDLLLARAYEALDKTDLALEEYEVIAGQFSGEEARCLYAQLLKKAGRTEEAETIFREIVDYARRSPAFYQKEQSEWVQIAKKELT